MPDIKILARDLGFPEGPVWMSDGSVILGEISGRRARNGECREITRNSTIPLADCSAL